MGCAEQWAGKACHLQLPRFAFLSTLLWPRQCAVSSTFPCSLNRAAAHQHLLIPLAGINWEDVAEWWHQRVGHPNYYTFKSQKIHTNNVQRGCISFDAGQPARSSVVDGVCGNEVRQQTLVRSPHPAKRRIVQACPRTVNYCYTVLHYSLPVKHDSILT